jgi:hypothetical protein
LRLRDCLSVFALFSASLSAHADSFRFSFGSASTTFSGSGLLTTGSEVAPGEFLIAAVTGTARTVLNGSNLNIASLLAPGTFPTPSNGGTFPSNDNFLFVLNGAGRPDENGFSFLLNGGAQINLFNGGTGVNALLYQGNGPVVYETAPLTITPVAPTPEPSSLALLCTGLLGCACRVKYRSA